MAELTESVPTMVVQLIELARPRLACFLLLGIRSAILVAVSPYPGRFVPGSIRATLVVTIALIGTIALPTSAVVTFSNAELVGAVVGEILYGGALAFGVWLSLSAVATCGQIAGTQMGFGLRGALDPASGSNMNAVARIAAMAWMPIALEMGMLHYLVRALCVPPAALSGVGGPLIERATLIAASVLAGSSQMFAAGLVGAGPVVGMAMISHAGLGAITRAVPNAMIIGEALGGAALLGMVAIGISASSWPGITRSTLTPLLEAFGG